MSTPNQLRPSSQTTGAAGTASPPLTRNDLKQFPSEVQARLIDITTNHGISWRMPDGGHVLLYNGDRGRPYKIAAKRPAQSTMDYLDKWVDTNIPGYFVVAEDTIEDEPEPEQSNDDPRAPGKPLIYSTGRTSVCFVWNANDDHSYLQCTMCSYSQEEARGAHLHEAKHTGAASRNAGIAGRVAGDRRTAAKEAKQAELELAQSAVELLAQYLGMPVGADQAEVDRLTSLLAVRDQQVDDLTRERDDLLTKLNMVKEVMGA